MLKYPCLVLDHDDTVVQSEKSIGYPYFCYILSQFRPGQTMTLQEFVKDCHDLGFAEMCRQRFQFTDEELAAEHIGWMGYIRTHIPDPYPGMKEIIQKQKAMGGLVCVVSHSSIENITRDYDVHIGIQPDAIYGWDLPEHQRKPNPFPLEDIMRRYDLTADQLLMVDDVKLAWVMANPLGVKTAFAAWSKTDYPELMQEMTQLCDYTFHTTTELEKFLFN